MKRIFGFLLTFGLVFAFAGEAFAQDVILKSGAKVRYMIEKKVITQDEASTLATQGYVDLWAYALFNKGYWEKAATGETLISFSGSTIEEWNIAFTPPTHSFMICDKNGNYTPSGSVLFSKPSTLSTCPSDRVPSQRGSTNGLCAIQFIRNVCPTYTYASSPVSGSSTVGAPNFIEDYTDSEGEWYRMKLYTIRYDYNSVQTFYTRFWSSYENGIIPPEGLNESPGASTFTVSFEGLAIKGSDNWTWADQDWQQHLRYDRNTNKYGFIMGGVEIIADPEMILSAEATCGGTDATGKLSVNDWAGKSWTDYGPVKYYVNKTGGTVAGRKQIAAGDITVTPAIPTSGSASEIAYTLTPAGYTLSDGSYADSLIWVIEDTFLA